MAETAAASRPAGRITGPHHIGLCAHEIEAARSFFSEVLGLEELERPPEIAAKFRSAWFLLGTVEMHVIENPDFQPLDSPLGPHIAVTTDDFDAVVEGVAATGTSFSFGPAKGPDGVMRAIVHDPTGNTFEITSLSPRV